VVCGEEKVILDEEVFAVILALAIVASSIGIALTWRPFGERFVAIGLLDESCKIGVYPKTAALNQSLKLCIYVYNHMGKPIAYQVMYKVALNASQLPTTSAPSVAKPLGKWLGALDNDRDEQFFAFVRIPWDRGLLGRNISLVFELWVFNTTTGSWMYSGVWGHIWVEVVG